MKDAYSKAIVLISPKYGLKSPKEAKDNIVTNDTIITVKFLTLDGLFSLSYTTIGIIWPSCDPYSRHNSPQERRVHAEASGTDTNIQSRKETSIPIYSDKSHNS
jgi:hypothetical protein